MLLHVHVPINFDYKSMTLIDAHISVKTTFSIVYCEWLFYVCHKVGCLERLECV